MYDKNANVIGSMQQEFTQIYPKPGLVEHDAEEIFKCQLMVLQNLIVENDVRYDQIAAIGITNQRETIVV